MSIKTIDTLLEDIDAIFTNPTHKVSEDNLKKFTDTLAGVVKTAIEKSGRREETVIRMSNLGTPDRKLYLDTKNPSTSEGNSAALEQRFLYGHVIEALLIFLIREAGHVVENEQLDVEVDGVPGHLDMTVDGVVVDAKSTSPYQFFKFQSPSKLKQNDTFGYVTQIAGYHEAMKRKTGIDVNRAAILVQNKSDADKRLLVFDEMEFPNIPDRIKHVRKMLAEPTLPPICHAPELDSKSGNTELASGCKFCRHKFGCFPTLRVFDYANGEKYFTSLVTVPRVPEIVIDKKTQQPTTQSSKDLGPKDFED